MGAPQAERKPTMSQAAMESGPAPTYGAIEVEGTKSSIPEGFAGRVTKRGAVLALAGLAVVVVVMVAYGDTGLPFGPATQLSATKPRAFDERTKPKKVQTRTCDLTSVAKTERKIRATYPERCLPYFDEYSCAWTKKWKCPKQSGKKKNWFGVCTNCAKPRGHGFLSTSYKGAPSGDLGYDCCCTYEGFRGEGTGDGNDRPGYKGLSNDECMRFCKEYRWWAREKDGDCACYARDPCSFGRAPSGTEVATLMSCTVVPDANSDGSCDKDADCGIHTDEDGKHWDGKHSCVWRKCSKARTCLNPYHHGGIGNLDVFPSRRSP